ncbi:MAG: conjugal transfer protein TraF [Woeseiaceae bacterium]
MPQPARLSFFLAAFLVVSFGSTLAYAGPSYGIYDARTMAMGGASVASSNNDNAQFYNAALLAFNEEIEEKTEDGRILLPLFIPEFSESVIDIEEISRDAVPQSIASSVANYNRLPGADTAQAVVDSSQTLDAYLERLDGEDLRADLYIGMGVSEPGKFQGAGFFAGARLLAGGTSTIADADRATLVAYQEGLSFVASDGLEGEAHPELFDANGALLNPNSTFESSASAIGVAITEVGVAMSKQFQAFGGEFAAGISFKVLDVEAFEDTERIVDDRISVQQNDEPETHINFDIGVAKQLGERWRLGIAVKDLVPHNYKTSLGTVIRLRPRPRIGISYQLSKLQFALDVDAIQSKPLGLEQATQEIAVGTEWALRETIILRAGYRYDMLGNRDGILSTGVGTRWKRLIFDAAYAQGKDSRAGALQLGIAF